MTKPHCPTSAAPPSSCARSTRHGPRCGAPDGRQWPTSWSTALTSSGPSGRLESLTPLRVLGDNGAGSELPERVRYTEMSGLTPTADAVLQRWAESPAGRSARAPIGLAADHIVAVDLLRDGPHALIAGTSGSGKSELLQTLVASLALANMPDALNFVLVDYKGGSAFAACAELPHCAGLITDLDGRLVRRALDSLSAELRRRERCWPRPGPRTSPTIGPGPAPDCPGW